MIFTLVVILLSLALLLDYCLRKRRYDMTANIPGPTFIPIVGTSMLFQKRGIKNSLDIVRTLSTKYGDIARTWIFQRLVILIKNPELLETLLSSPKHITKHTLYGFLTSWLGEGLLLSKGSKWHARRKIITPTFHFKILDEFVEIFDQQSEILTRKLEKHLDGTEFNIYPSVALAALDILCETAMGTKINAQTDPDCDFVRSVAEITTILTERFLSIWFRSETVFNLFAPKMRKQQNEAIRKLHRFTEHVIEERRKSLKAVENIKQVNFIDDAGIKKKHALLDVLLQSTINGKPLTNADIREEVDTFMFEGHDTTASSMCFTLYLLSRHPEIQQKAFQEICEVIGTDKNKKITFRHLQDLKFLECVIKESLRLYPSVPVIGRLITEDTKIGDYLFPTGANISIPIFVLLKDPKIFPDPEYFKPERHFSENIAGNVNPFSFIPFSAGPRNCIGQRFAMLEMKGIVSKILRNFELLPLGPDPIPVIKLVLKSFNGVHIGIKAR